MKSTASAPRQKRASRAASRPGSLDQRIRADIVDKITSGAWRPGHKIPTERELTEAYGCARMTVSKAIASLVLAGYIERNKKAGSFVCQPPIETAAFDIPDLSQLIRARGDSYAFDLKAREIGSDADGVPGPDGMRGELLRIDGVHKANGLPFATEHRVISLTAAPEARSVDFAAESPGTWLTGHIPWSSARHRISARSAGADAGWLDLDKTAACLCVERWTWHAGVAVTYVKNLFPGHRYDLIAEFSPR